MTFKLFESAEGDLRETFALANGATNFNALIEWLTLYEGNDNFFLFFTDFVYELTNELASILGQFGIDLSGLLVDENTRKYSQVGGIFTQNGESKLISISPDENGMFHYGLKGFVGPVSLAGEKAGWDFGFEVENDWKWNGQNTTSFTVEDVQSMIDNVNPPNAFRNNAFQKINYSSSTKGQPQIITLHDDVSSWEVGDEIVIASTGYDSRESEVFTIVDCDSCNSNQVKLDRVADYTHWGRISYRTGIDQLRKKLSSQVSHPPIF